MTKIIPDFLHKNIVLKILSCILGASMWYFVVGEDQIDVTINVPIEVHNLPPQLVIANQFRKDIEATIRGPHRIIQEIRKLNVSRPVDLSGVEAGAIVIKNDGDSIPFPEGISVLRLQPTHITLLVDQLVHKDLAINRPEIKGEPESGYHLHALTMEPEKFTVSGPKSILDQQKELQTFSINLDGLDKPTTMQVPLRLTPQMLNLIGEAIVTVSLDIQESMLIKTVRGIPVNVRDTGLSFQAQPSMIAAQAEIPENLIRDTPELAMLFRAFVNPPENREEKDVLVEVTVSSIAVPGHREIKVTKITPAKIRLVKIDPQE